MFYHAVASSSGKDFYAITYFPETQKYHCECPGYFYRGTCRHVRQVADLVEAGFDGSPMAPKRRQVAA